MNKLDYNVGDQVFIFSPSSWGPGSFLVARVTKITPGGQVVTEREGIERRFMPSGKEIGASRDSYRGGPWIEAKASAAERAAVIRRANAELRLKTETKGELERLARLEPIHQRAELIAGLRALTEKLSAE